MKGWATALEPYTEHTGVHPESARFADIVVDHARHRPRRTALGDAVDGARLDFAGLADRTRRLRRVLAAHTRPGDAVGVALAHPVDYAAALIGVIAAGRLAVPLDPGAPGSDLARTLRAAGAGAVLADPDRDLGLPDPVTVLDPLADTDTAADDAADDEAADDEAAGPGAIVLATSGSTGEPKVVRLDEPRLLHVARCVAGHNELTPDDVGYCTLPLFHVNAEVVAVLASLVAGAQLVLRSRFSRREFWNDLDRCAATWVNAVPAILAILADDAPPRPTALRFVRSASAPLPGPTRARVERTFGVPVVESYGMTEAASQITAAPLDGSGPVGSAGRPVGVQLEIRRRDGSPADVGEVGRVWIRGPGVIGAYEGGRAADRFDAEGWLDTADLGSLDDDGFLFLAGRSDDVINRGGEMVYPAAIEQVLLADPRVREAVVVAAPHDVLGSVPDAFVISDDSGTDTDRDTLARDLMQRCNRELGRAARPQAVHVVADLPRAATGKIVRREVRAALEGSPTS